MFFSIFQFTTFTTLSFVPEKVSRSEKVDIHNSKQSLSGLLLIFLPSITMVIQIDPDFYFIYVNA